MTISLVLWRIRITDPKYKLEIKNKNSHLYQLYLSDRPVYACDYKPERSNTHVSFYELQKFLTDQSFISPFDVIEGNRIWHTCFAFNDKSNDILFKLKFD